MKLKLRKIGNSWGVIFPKEDIDEFIEAEEIEVEIIYPENKYETAQKGRT